MKQLKRNYSCILVLILTLAKLAGYGQTFAVNDNGININNTAINWVVARGMTAPPRWTIPVNNPSYNSSNGFVTAIATNFLSYQNGGNCYNSNGIWYPITNNPPNGWAPDDSTPVFFRLAFNLPNGTITNCHLHFFIDDSLALYINGSFVAAQYHAVADFSQNQIGSLFRCGDNVIAILGKNSQTPCYMLNFDVYSDSYITIDTTQHINLNFNLPPDTMFCNGHGSVSLHVPIVTDYYHWNTGDSTSGIFVTYSGTFIVTA
ncbi:MAG: hypothetical protein JWO06_3161 [Bacteroidota bacterium]|nr:hypothetical protein [Bacteroidota bacterium]